MLDIEIEDTRTLSEEEAVLVRRTAELCKSLQYLDEVEAVMSIVFPRWTIYRGSCHVCPIKPGAKDRCMIVSTTDTKYANRRKQ